MEVVPDDKFQSPTETLPLAENSDEASLEISQMGNLICPLTKEQINTPLSTRIYDKDGKFISFSNFEQDALIAWMEQCECDRIPIHHPVTKEPLERTSLEENLALVLVLSRLKGIRQTIILNMESHLKNA